MLLKDVLPQEFFNGEYEDSVAQKYVDVSVVQEHGYNNDNKPWPGIHRNVHVWYELSNGYAVGWNENPSRGWSFPVIKIKKTR